MLGRQRSPRARRLLLIAAVAGILVATNYQLQNNFHACRQCRLLPTGSNFTRAQDPASIPRPERRSNRHAACLQKGKSAFSPEQSQKLPMKKYCWILLIAFAAGLRAADAPKINSTNSPAAGTNEPPAAKAEAGKIPDATHKPVLTTNTVTIAGQRVTYVAETGMLPLLKPDGTSRASVFYVAYTRTGQTNPAARPVMFCFNGGPGSSSVWLHLGAFGPRRVKMNDDGTLPPPPSGLVDNEYSILDGSDLVFIDPVATGFSRPVKDEKPDQFFSDSADLDSVGEFIRLWTTRHERWLSPKYLCGESYGVFRAAGLADHLFSRYGMYLNGLILVSGVLDFATIRDNPGNDVPYPLYLPAYTATAHFHKKLPSDLQSDLPRALTEAREFAQGGYASALQQGKSLPADEYKKVAAELARLTGLKPQVIEDNHLRIDEGVFRKQLLHDEGLILGRYDARITGRDDDPASSYPGFDPSYAATLGPFSAAMNSYVRGELKFEDDLPYEILKGRPWDYGVRNNYANAEEKLADTMNQNPYMRLLVLGGRCDLACPIDTVHYALDHMSLDAAYRTNITCAEYDAGHMMYVNLPDLKKMQRDLESFLK
jgi:carboxypeptidase C (cathepsin A)